MQINKLVLTTLLMTVLTGCASLDERVRTHADNAYRLAKDGSGEFFAVVGHQEATVKEACDAIENKDDRCKDQSKFKARLVAPAVGFSAGVAATTALIPKEIDIRSCDRPAWEACDYVKVRAEPGKLSTLLEVVTGQCNWNGLNGAGGVVCPSLNWDYRKDLRVWDTVGGRMKVNSE